MMKFKRYSKHCERNFKKKPKGKETYFDEISISFYFFMLFLKFQFVKMKEARRRIFAYFNKIEVIVDEKLLHGGKKKKDNFFY